MAGGHEDDLERERRTWRAFPRRRPRDIQAPGPEQESVWDYPRPPRVEPVAERARVEFNGVIVADSRRALRVLETASPPTVYLPPEDVQTSSLLPAEGESLCEWKGLARYWTLRVGARASERAAWSYPRPDPAYGVLANYLAFYPGRVDGCFLGERRVSAQAGAYYGGWITPNLLGPFKGAPGTEDW